jgi:hypothetical protein
VNVTGTGALVFIGVVVLVVGILWFIPTFYDLRRADQWRSDQQSKLLGKMVDAASVKGLSVEDVRQIASAMNAPPRGAQGLTQALIGLIVTTLVGIALLATLVSTAGDSSDLRKTIITALLSILATIAGFYFGARTAQISSEQASRPPTPTGGPTTGPAVTVTKVDPDNGGTGGNQAVTVTGSGFSNAIAVRFGTEVASNLTVTSDSQLTVTSPKGAAGQVHVTVTTPAGTSAITPADQYTYTKSTE